MNELLGREKCSACGEAIKRGEDFILEGKFPSLSEKIRGGHASFGRLSWFGGLYHKRCYEVRLRG